MRKVAFWHASGAEAFIFTRISIRRLRWAGIVRCPFEGFVLTAFRGQPGPAFFTLALTERSATAYGALFLARARRVFCAPG